MSFIPDEDLYESNWELLRQQDPQTAYRLYSSEPSPAYRFCMTKKGELNLQNGEHTFHSPEGAIDEANAIAADKDLKAAVSIYFYGIGLGYMYQALQGWLKQNPKRHLVILDDDLDAIRSFLYTKTATEFLQNPQTTLCYFQDIDTDSDPLYRLFSRFADTEPQFLTLPLYERTKRSQSSSLCYKALFETAIIGPAFYEALSGGVGFFDNYYPNLLRLYDSHLGTGLFDKFKNVPAIICGAGPSLNKQLPFLKTLTDRALIFAGGSAFNALTAHGVLPHFGAGVDPNPEQTHRLLTNHGFQIPFVYRHRLPHKALELIQGPKLYIPRHLGYALPDWVDEQLGIPLPEIDEGHNVTHFCTEMARLMGCNPIIFVGLDLAFTDNKPYSEGINTHPLWLDGRSPYESAPNTRVVQTLDYKQQPITTQWNWIGESHWYSSYAQSYPDVQFFNATEGGLPIAPVPNVSLKEIAEQKLTQAYDLAGQVHAEIQCHPIGITRGKIFQVIGTLKQTLIESQKICSDIVKELTTHIEKIDKGSIQPISPYSAKAVLGETDLIETIAYQQLLKSYAGAYMAPIHAQYASMKKSYNPNIVEQARIALGKYHYLNNALTQNLATLNAAVQQFLLLPPPSEQIVTPVKEVESDPIRTEGQYRDGKLDGPYRIYAATGQLLSESVFVAGKRQGECRQFYLSGALYSLQRYQDNAFEGEQKYYYESGKPKAIIHYKNGLLDGLCVYYNCAGTIQRELNYRAGKRHGSEKMWDSEGRLLIECHYENGLPDGTAREWNHEGKLVKEVVIKAYPHLFDFTSWDVHGNIIKRFINGIEDFTPLYEQKKKESSEMQESIELVLGRLAGLMKGFVEKSSGNDVDAEILSGVKNDLAGIQEQLIQVHQMRSEMEDKMNSNLKSADQARQQNIDRNDDQNS